MLVKVHEHTIEIVEKPVNELEVNVTKITFEFDESMENLTKEAYFTYNNHTYKVLIQNNECYIPNEVLVEKGTIELGVVAFEVEDEETLIRYNPKPVYFATWEGSLKEADNTEPITPTDKEQIESAIAQLQSDVEELDNTKQDTLVSGENIKTINNESLLGSGNLEVITDLSDYYTKEEIDNKGYINKDVDDLTNYTKTSDLSEVATSGSYNDLEDTPNLSVYSLITETGAKIDLEINSSTYVLTAKLYDKNNDLLSTSTGIDLPLETMVVGASYDSETKEIVLTLKNGQEVRFSVADLVSGLVSETQLEQILLNYYTKSEVDTLLSNKANVSDIPTKTSDLTNDSNFTNKTYVDNANEVQDNEISDLKSENDYLNSIINQLPKVSSQGTILTLNNTIEAKMEVELNPSELEQETTGGNNLYNGVYTPKKFAKKSDGAVGSSDDWSITDYIEIDENTNYIYSGITNSWSTTAGTCFYDNNKTFISSIGSNTYSFTTPSNAKYMRISLNSETPTNIMLNKGTTALPFEKYTGGIPAPNPSFPMLIHTISGNNTIKVFKNLIDKDNPNLINNYALTEPSNNKGWVSENNDYVVYIPCKKSTLYKITKIQSDRLRISTTIDNPTTFPQTYDYYDYQDTTQANYTTNSTANYLCIFFRRFSDALSMQEILNTLIVYEVNTMQEANINLGDIEYCEIGDYKDEFVRSSGKNLFDENITPENYYYNASGVKTYDNAHLFINQEINNVNYNSIIISYLSVVGSANIRICEYNSNGNFITRTLVNTNNQIVNLNNATTKIIFSVNADNNMKYNNLMINKGNTALPYEPYGIGNWGIRKNIGKVVLDGSENWSKTGDTNVSVFTTAISGRNTSLSSSSMSDYFKYQFANNVGAFYFGSASYDTCAFCMENTYTIETFKTWLGTHNVSVYIILATPTYTPITGDLAEQLENIYQYLLSYKGQTNISQVPNDLPFNINASALRDLSTL